MIINDTGYNPFPVIVERVAKIKCNGLYAMKDVDFFLNELFRGGIVAETEDEADYLLNTLKEMDII